VFDRVGLALYDIEIPGHLGRSQGEACEGDEETGGDEGSHGSCGSGTGDAYSSEDGNDRGGRG